MGSGSAPTSRTGTEDRRRPLLRDPRFVESPPMEGGEIRIVDARGCDPDLLRSEEALRSLFAAMVGELGLHPLGPATWHAFPAPGGITGFLLLSESHLACHTFPPPGFAAHGESSGDGLSIVSECCPFGETAQQYPHVVCALDRGIIRGMLAGLYGETSPHFEASRPEGPPATGC